MASSPTGNTATLSPERINPCTTLPRTVTFFPSDDTSVTIPRRGFSYPLLAGVNPSNASNSVGPLYHFLRAFHPSASSTLSFLEIFTPVSPLTGTNVILASLNPFCFKKSSTNALICSKRSWLHAGSAASNLFTATTNCVTPNPRDKTICSLVCPPTLYDDESPPPLPPANPASNSPVVAATTSSPQSALAVPLIIFGIKSACPGASNTVKSNLSVLANLVPISIVTPRSRSLSSSSVNQASANDDLPIDVAAFWYFWSNRCDTWFNDNRSRPVNVDLPASTWPKMTSDKCGRIASPVLLSERRVARMLDGSCGIGILFLLADVVAVVALLLLSAVFAFPFFLDSTVNPGGGLPMEIPPLVFAFDAIDIPPLPPDAALFFLASLIFFCSCSFCCLSLCCCNCCCLSWFCFAFRSASSFFLRSCSRCCSK